MLKGWSGRSVVLVLVSSCWLLIVVGGGQDNNGRRDTERVSTSGLLETCSVLSFWWNWRLLDDKYALSYTLKLITNSDLWLKLLSASLDKEGCAHRCWKFKWADVGPMNVAWVTGIYRKKQTSKQVFLILKEVWSPWMPRIHLIFLLIHARTESKKMWLLAFYSAPSFYCKTRIFSP